MLKKFTKKFIFLTELKKGKHLAGFVIKESAKDND